jgi:thioredoxin 2
MSSPQTYLFRCPSCKTKNRIPADKVGNTAKCGRCKGSLATRELMLPQPVMVTDRNFDEMVLASPLPVLLDCWASWCSACSLVSPVVEELGRSLKGRARVGKLNVEANPLLTARYDLRSLPTLLIFDGGKLKETLVGSLPKAYILQHLRPYMA